MVLDDARVRSDRNRRPRKPRRRQLLRRLFVPLAFSCAFALVAGCLSLHAIPTSNGQSLEDSIVFQPTRFPDGNWQPERLDFEDAWFESADGTKLHGWYYPNAQARATVLIAHGNAGNLSDRAYLLRALHDRFGVSSFVFDYRGYGRSEGTPSEQGVLLDAHAARDWLAQREGIDPRDIVLFGRSLGGAVMVDLAAEEGARGLILMNTFTSLTDVARSKFGRIPVRVVLKNRLDSLAKIDRYRGPLLQSHGDADRVIPYRLGRQLFEAAHEPKRFVTVPGADHNDPPNVEVLLALDRFFDSLPASTTWSGAPAGRPSTETNSISLPTSPRVGNSQTIPAATTAEGPSDIPR